jgi:glycosyltransferase involved in cell wall biosynthesis
MRIDNHIFVIHLIHSASCEIAKAISIHIGANIKEKDKKDKMTQLNNDKSPLLSVIVPIYNAEKYLEECISSIVKQTFRDFELICVDDGSTDSSFLILESYTKTDDRLIIINQKNRGAGAARNNGFSKAKGKYVCFLDADDFCDICFFDKMLLQIQNEDAEICICEARKFNDSKKRIDGHIRINRRYMPQQRTFSSKDIYKYIYNICATAPWNKFYLRSYLSTNNIAFQETMRANDLYFFLLSFAQATKITFLAEELLSYRTGMKHNSQSTNEEYPMDFFHALIKARTDLRNIGIFGNVEQSFMNYAYKHCIYNLNSQEDTPRQSYIFYRMKEEIIPGLNMLDYSDELLYSDRYKKTINAIMNSDMEGYLRYRNEYLKERIAKLNDKNRRYKNKLKKINNSKLYRIGLAIAALPRKIRRVVKGSNK